MTARFPLLRALCALCALCVNSFFLFSSASLAQNLDKPLQSIDEDITAFAYAPDGRIVYSVYRKIKTKVFDALEHDDIWLQEANGKRRRLLEGQKYTRGNQSFSYLIDSFRWSPNGHFILAQLLTTTVLDDTGKTEDSIQTLLLDDSGKEIHINKGGSVIPDAANASWQPDNATIAYLSEAVKPRLLFSLKFTRPATGALPSFYEGRTFRDIAWLPGVNSVIVVEQNRALTGPSRLQRLDLISDDAKELATLESYEGGLSVSPSGKKVAYFIDKEILEIRDLTSLNRVARLRVGLGVFRWSPDESRILLKRSIEKKSGDLVWIDLPPLAASSGHDAPVSQPQPVSILHGLSFRDFAISPDGRFLAVVITGKRNLLVFPLPSR
jgi:dipeptidyl aminopeptidase/acylaminoacyl peptidase